jgi:hypothetical protein
VTPKNPRESNTPGAAAVAYTVLFGGISEVSHILVVGVLLCVAYGLIYVWCDLCRIEAVLRDMLAASKLKQAKDASEKHKRNGEPLQPSSQVDQLLRHVVKLQRKAFLLRRNADKLDHLIFKPFRLFLQVFGKSDIKSRARPIEVHIASVRRNSVHELLQLGRQGLANKLLDFVRVISDKVVSKFRCFFGCHTMTDAIKPNVQDEP